MRKISALILAKKNSRRLHNKNILDFGGIPMFLVNVIKCVDIFDKVYVSSDDDDILDWADSRGAIAIKRPVELCGDVPNIPVYKHAVQFMKDTDAFVAVQANSPGISPQIIERAKELMQSYNEIMTVHRNGSTYGSIWGLSKEKLDTYKEVFDYYNPTPECKFYDDSIDIHTKKEYLQAKKDAKC